MSKIVGPYVLNQNVRAYMHNHFLLPYVAKYGQIWHFVQTIFSQIAYNKTLE